MICGCDYVEIYSRGRHSPQRIGGGLVRTRILSMPKPGEYITVQSRILKYAEDIGWIYIVLGLSEAYGSD